MNRTTFSVSFFYQRTQRVASVTQVHDMDLLPHRSPGQHWYQNIGNFLVHLLIYMKSFVGGYPPTQTPTQKFKSGLSMYDSQEISSGLISLRMIFEALQSELFRLKFQF